MSLNSALKFRALSELMGVLKFRALKFLFNSSSIPLASPAVAEIEQPILRIQYGVYLPVRRISLTISAELAENMNALSMETG